MVYLLAGALCFLPLPSSSPLSLPPPFARLAVSGVTHKGIAWSWPKNGLQDSMLFLSPPIPPSPGLGPKMDCKIPWPCSAWLPPGAVRLSPPASPLPPLLPLPRTHHRRDGVESRSRSSSSSSSSGSSSSSSSSTRSSYGSNHRRHQVERRKGKFPGKMQFATT